jgi:ABC-type multidrug transport system permease subunit
LHERSINNLHRILASPTALPGCWIFTYRLSPFTYLVSAILSTGLAGAPAYCSDIEVLHFEPPSNLTCGEYLTGYIEMAGGYLVDAAAEMGIGGQGLAGGDNGECAYCPVSSTDAILGTLGVRWDERWRNFGIMFVYVGVNVVGAGAIYWAVRVPKRKG